MRILLSTKPRTCEHPMFFFPQELEDQIFGWYTTFEHALVCPLGLKYKDQIITLDVLRDAIIENLWTYYADKKLQIYGWKHFIKQIDDLKEAYAFGIGNLYWLIRDKKIEILLEREDGRRIFTVDELSDVIGPAIYWRYMEILCQVELFTQFRKVEAEYKEIPLKNGKPLFGFWIVIENNRIIDFGYTAKDGFITRKCFG
ncbi:MAG: hypothetical protein QXW98_04255 [Candidatus Caldarchaeum sp.]